MESKRLGLCQKSMFVVPNHLTEQWASEFLRLYPSARILVTTKKDFETSNRKKFCARIATGDYDAVIIGHSQFEKIPVSHERQEQLLQDQIDEIMMGITELKESNGERFSIKQLEKSKKQLEIKNQALMDYIKAAICVLDDQTTEARHKTAYTAGLLSVAEEGANRNVARGYFTPTPKWRIRYADGTVGYQLYERKYAVEIAEKKKDEYGGSYTIEPVE